MLKSVVNCTKLSFTFSVIVICVVCLELFFKAKQLGTTQLDEDGLFELIKTKPGKAISYEQPATEKKPRKKRKSDTVESVDTMSQGKDQLECESSQMSERSTSSPATQTPSASPNLKGLLLSHYYI